MTAKTDFRIPGTFTAAILHVLQAQNLDIDPHLDAVGLPRDLDVIQNRGLHSEQWEQLLERLVPLAPSLEFAFIAGDNLPATAHGTLGFAMLCSETFEHAVQVCLRYWDLIGRGCWIDLQVTQNGYTLLFAPSVDVSPVMERIMLESMIAAVHRACEGFFADVDEHMEFGLSLDAPDYLDNIRTRIPGIRYGAPSNYFKLNNTLLKRPMPMANASALRLALEQCDQLMSVWSFPNRLTPMIQKHLGIFSEGFPNLTQMADRIGMPERSLRRRLMDEGVRYSQLLEQIRKRDALHLLEHSRLDIATIAERLGYQDPANFTRAFKKWTGKTPMSVRKPNG